MAPRIFFPFFSVPGLSCCNDMCFSPDMLALIYRPLHAPHTQPLEAKHTLNRQGICEFVCVWVWFIPILPHSTPKYHRSVAYTVHRIRCVTHTHTHTYTQTHRHMHARTHALTHTQTQTQSLKNMHTHDRLLNDVLCAVRHKSRNYFLKISVPTHTQIHLRVNIHFKSDGSVIERSYLGQICIFGWGYIFVRLGVCVCTYARVSKIALENKVGPLQ